MKYRLLIIGFLLSIGLITISGFYALTVNRQVLISTKEDEGRYKILTTAAAEVSSYAKRAEGHLFLYLALHRKVDGEKFPKRIKSLNEQISVLDENINNPDARIILEKIKENAANTLPTGNKLIVYHDKAMETAGKFELAKHRETIFDLHEKFSAIRRLGVSLVAHEAQIENDLKAAILKNSKRLHSHMIFLISATSIFALFLGYLLIKMVCSLDKEIAKRKQSEKEIRDERNKLEDALEKVNTLRGLLPICASCKKIRDDNGYWNQIEIYIQQHSEAEFSHGVCPECFKKYYPEFSGNNE